MLVARGRLERRQAIVNIVLQRFVPAPLGVAPVSLPSPHEVSEYRALLDTGAQRTCLARGVIGAAGLRRHGKLFIKNVNTEALHSKFMANLAIVANCNTVGEDVTGLYGLPAPVEVIDIAENERFDAILGMDVLENFDLSIRRNGDFELVMG